MKKVHLIAIGGAVMHNLAIALKRKRYEVTGSDDLIYDPARSNLEQEGLLPKDGWDADHIHSDLDLVILGMHAREGNPELERAMELGIPVMSFPEFIARESSDKTRVVIAGSHGKTTSTAMLMHALQKLGVDFDYLVGSSIDGFELSVRLSDAPLILIEGDEYLSSPLDRRSKFLWYEPDISIITGIAYDHVNVFPTFESYLQTFRDFIKTHGPEASIFWFEGDEYLQQMQEIAECDYQAYTTPNFKLDNGNYSMVLDKEYPLSLIGEHNLQNLQAASLVAEKLGITPSQFFEAMADFTGAGKRMEKIYEQNGQVVFRDFAHSPSKLLATTEAVAYSYHKKLLAVFELHTFSSLNADFLPYYENAMDAAEQAIVYVDPHVFEHRKLEPIPLETIKACFGSVQVLNDPTQLKQIVEQRFREGWNVLLMSSGTFSGTTFKF